MAGDWIKFEVNTPEKHEVLAITSMMGWDDPDLTIGKLLRVWRWFDQQTLDGNAPSVTAALLDRIVGTSGFAKAMSDVGWLKISNSGISLPNFDRHNGKTAKERALTAKRVALHKANAKSNAPSNELDNGNTNDVGNAPIVTGALPREEKNKEDINKNTPPNPPSGEGEGSVGTTPSQSTPKRERKPRTTLKTFVHACTKAGEKPISGYRPLLEYVQATGLPMEFVQLAWEVFKSEFLPGGTNESRVQADWRRHFLNYVKKGYFRLWYVKPAGEDGKVEYLLSSTGLQAKAATQHREAA